MKAVNTRLNITQDGLAAVLTAADDRQNNLLVVNTMGEWQVAGINCRIEFPVRFEAFCAGNNYVGRYAEWGCDQLFDWCEAAKRNWDIYVATNRSQHVDIV